MRDERRPSAGQLRPLEVSPRPGEAPDKMIRRFVKRVRNDGVLREVFDRRAYQKPSQRKRRKRARAQFNRAAGAR